MLSFLPSLLILILMPGIVVKLNYALSVEELTKDEMLKKVMQESRRESFVKALRDLLSLLVLFREADNCIDAKIKTLKGATVPTFRPPILAA